MPPIIDPSVQERMQQEWNARAIEDANFYVAFGRRDQDPEEFFATAAEVVQGLEWEMRRLPASTKARTRRALEIGCGPGRLMRPMSKHFGEIHGVDVSNEMITRARTNLVGIPHAHAHHTVGSDLAPFADESFDFVYSYAVFQHIPSFEVVQNYWLEAYRVLKPGGVVRVQINGLPQSAGHYDTWSGVRVSSGQVREFTLAHDFQLLALEGVDTQYMWTTWRRPNVGSIAPRESVRARIRRITNSHSSEPVATPIGRYSSVTLWMEDLPEAADLNTLEILLGGRQAFACYIGPRERDGLQQLNVMIPPGTRTGLQSLEILWLGEPLLCEEASVRIIPPGPQVPQILSFTDGVNMLSGQTIVSGTVKVTVEELFDVREVQAFLNDVPIPHVEVFCADPLPPRYEINVFLPKGTAAGPHNLYLGVAGRRLGPLRITVAG